MQPRLVTTDNLPCWISRVGGAVRAGFPSPAEDFGQEPINLTKLLVRHPQATFFVRVAGDSMIEAGIFDGDYVLVDRAVKAEVGHIVVAVVDGEFTIKYLRRGARGYYLEAANKTYPPIYPDEGTELEVWGVARTAFRPLPGFQISG